MILGFLEKTLEHRIPPKWSLEVPAASKLNPPTPPALKLPLTVPRIVIQTRVVWQFRDADWDGLRKAMFSEDWSWRSGVDANIGAEQFTARVLELAGQFIPKRCLHERKSTHPWINETVLRAVREKLAAQGTDLERERQARKHCSACIMEEYCKYVAG